MNVLFIGNSYTYFNKLWDVFQNVAKSAGEGIEVDSVTKGGYFLYKMNDPADEYGAQVAERLTRTPSFDAVILQEQSCEPVLNEARFALSVKSLSEKWKERGARVILYETWGRKTGNAKLDELNLTSESMTKALAAAYHRVCDANGLAVSPVGDAFYDVYTHHPEIDLYNADLHHPSPAGTYLAALCHYAVLFGKSPVGISYAFGVADETQKQILQQAAQKAVFERV